MGWPVVLMDHAVHARLRRKVSGSEDPFGLGSAMHPVNLLAIVYKSTQEI